MEFNFVVRFQIGLWSPSEFIIIRIQFVDNLICRPNHLSLIKKTSWVVLLFDVLYFLTISWCLSVYWKKKCKLLQFWQKVISCEKMFEATVQIRERSTLKVYHVFSQPGKCKLLYWFVNYLNFCFNIDMLTKKEDLKLLNFNF